MTIDSSTATLLVSALIQSGLVGWIIRREYKLTALGGDVATLQAGKKELEGRVAKLETSALLHSSVIEDIRKKLDKLDQIDRLVTTMEFIKEQMSQFVTRAEFDARLAGMN